MYETGAMRRTHLRQHPNILKRLLIHGAAFNLGLLMRGVAGGGTPKQLRERAQAVLITLDLLKFFCSGPNQYYFMAESRGNS